MRNLILIIGTLLTSLSASAFFENISTPRDLNNHERQYLYNFLYKLTGQPYHGYLCFRNLNAYNIYIGRDWAVNEAKQRYTTYTDAKNGNTYTAADVRSLLPYIEQTLPTETEISRTGSNEFKVSYNLDFVIKSRSSDYSWIKIVEELPGQVVHHFKIMNDQLSYLSSTYEVVDRTASPIQKLLVIQCANMNQITTIKASPFAPYQYNLKDLSLIERACKGSKKDCSSVVPRAPEIVM